MPLTDEQRATLGRAVWLFGILSAALVGGALTADPNALLLGGIAALAVAVVLLIVLFASRPSSAAPTVTRPLWTRVTRREARRLTDDELCAKARDLAEHLRRFVAEQSTRQLVPFELIGDERSQEREAEGKRQIVALYEQHWEDQVSIVYEEIRARRSVENPIMEGRYNAVRTPTEVETIAMALDQMCGG